ncbi:MAG: LytS/YhcK type 5TM receptor domain-containing protein, partial [Chloroflexota bacterium]
LFKQGMYRLEAYPPIVKQLIIGITFGLFGIVNIMMSIELAPGIILDLRNPLVLVAGIFGGGIGAFASAGIIALYRVLIVGGVGSFSAVIGIFSVASLATYWHYKKSRPTTSAWALLGLLSVSTSIIIGFIMLPGENRIIFLEAFVPMAVIFYPLLTVLLGSFINHELQDFELRHELAVSQQRFRAIFDQTFQFIGLLERDGTLIEANQTTLAFAGLQPDDVINKPFWDAKWWSASEETKTQLQAAIKRASKGEFVRYNADVVGADNQTTTIDFSLKPVFDAEGKVSMLIPEGRDISAEILAQQRQLELQVEQERNKMLRQFIQDSSHHLKTPVTILKTSRHLMNKHMELIEKTISSADASSYARIDQILSKCKRQFSSMDNAITSLMGVIDNLLELTRIDKTDTVNI